jgi:hypothetical protein
MFIAQLSRNFCTTLTTFCYDQLLNLFFLHVGSKYSIIDLKKKLLELCKKHYSIYIYIYMERSRIFIVFKGDLLSTVKVVNGIVLS